MNADSTIFLASGRNMPVLGLGTWQLSDHTAETIVTALQLGYRLIDTSGDYGTQPGIGEGLKQSGAKRDDYYLVTKVEETDDAYQATQKNLQELQLDYADLILIHRPPDSGVGLELWQGLQQARDEGLTRDIGVSNYSIDQLEALSRTSGEIPTVNQIEWTPFGHSEDMLNYCNDHGITIQAYSPLTRSKRLDDNLLDDMAANYDKSAAQLIIRWNLQLGTVPIIKASQPEHLRENLDVFDFEISADDMATLNGLNEHYSSLSSKPLYT
jgi:diketogulonate reductase-like aldo/keto reductase